ncbi:unnamed protein product [Rotaria sordida]|uniref:G-protein coupled receptors family 1 profile domain-containing protein n=1 Tax=Rotaria sordida TaxID=392033 RepID=A0A815BP56_9BILA|nr:unnamed protein product [Rotaria sordida]CAF1268738.1 unnamed protein product [Rotaria sordida]CAF1274363.1 unnamed protein product [Rotaria sordida]CAF1389065.1 unnamed protein product [Rotaria sordida]CAF1535116.1 unnamed protein product [Rotaria sordida]
MIDEDSTFNISNSSEIIVNDVIPKIVGFWLYIIFLIPSIICSFIIISYLLFHRPSRNALNNHVILVDLIIGLISELTLYPSILYYYRYDGIWHRSRTFCAIWSFIDSGLYVTQMVLVCWASIERHILIFHSRWMMTKKKLFFIHYLPLILILLYCMIYYSIAHFFPPCENYFDDSTMQCCYLCFYDYYALFMWEMIAHEIIPSIIIVISSITLIARVSWQKHRVNQLIQWRKQRKMVIQLLSISLLFVIFFFPLTVMNFLYLCGLPSDMGTEVFEYILFLSYYMPLLLPFVCILSLPGLRNKIINILRSRRHVRRIRPAILCNEDAC